MDGVVLRSIQCFIPFSFVLDPPRDNGGAEISKYLVEMDDGRGKLVNLF